MTVSVSNDVAKTSQSKFYNSFFSVISSTNSSNFYKIQEITLEEDCTVSINAIEFPCDSENKSLISSIITNDDKYEFNPR